VIQESDLIDAEEQGQKIANGLAKLVLTLLETLKGLMERQARRRMNEGSLSEQQVERLGLTFEQLNDKIGEMAKIFGLDRSELRLGLNVLDWDSSNNRQSLPQLASPREILSLVDLLDRVVEKGIVVFGDLGLSVAEVELINVQLRIVVNAVKNQDKLSSRKSSTSAQEKQLRYVGRKKASHLLGSCRRKSKGLGRHSEH
jgi:hypothetical protein